MELFKANTQWSKRPKDERFTTLIALYNATKAYADVAKEKIIPYDDIRVENFHGDVNIVGKANVPARLTHWAFGQIAARAYAPASYLRTLPATLACQNINHGLADRKSDDTAQLMFHTNGGLLLRALTSERYSRIWNYEVAERLCSLENTSQWKPAVPDMEAEKLPLYASDHDMFAFLKHENTISEPGNPDGLHRGIIVENSEVGASALRLTRFLYRTMCGNHIIWGASKVVEISLRHVGNARSKWSFYAGELRKYAESSTSDEEGKISRAREFTLGGTKEDVLNRLFGMRKLNLSRKSLESSYDLVNPEQDGDAHTVWGMVQGITRYSQTIPYADERTKIDRSAGKLMELVF